MKKYEKTEVEVIELNPEERMMIGVGEGSTQQQLSPRQRVIEMEEEN